MDAIQHMVTDIITRDCGKILPDAGTLRRVMTRADRRLGFHIITSPRFVSTLRLSGQNDRPIEVKLFVKHRPNVEKEYNNMRLLWKTHYAEARKYHIPEPLIFDREHCLLFMRYWQGESFLPLFCKNGALGRQRRVAMVESYVRGAAEWLADFQGVYSSGEEREAPSEMSDFDSRLKETTFLDRTTQRRISQKLSSLQNALPRLRETYVHDQYLFRNILCRNGKVCVVDFPHLRKGWPLYDFFTFYTGIERLKQYPIVSNSTCELMKATFASAYFSRNGMRYDAESLDNLWAFFLVSYVAKRYRFQQFKGVRGILNNIFVKRMFGKLAAWSKK